MKLKMLLVLGIGLAGSFSLWAQSPEKIQIKRGEVAVKAIPFHKQYRFSEFQEGSIVLLNNKVVPAKLNYNFLFEEVHFLNEENDTLSLGHEVQLKQMTVGDTRFYDVPYEGLVEEIEDYHSIKLARKQVLEVVWVVGYIKRRDPKDPIDYAELYRKKAPTDYVLENQASYFFIDKNSRFYKAKRSSILKIFRRYKNTVRNYIQENNINFEKEEDLNKLLVFCSQLGDDHGSADHSSSH